MKNGKIKNINSEILQTIKKQYIVYFKSNSRLNNRLVKVHIFWEGHKNFAKSPPYFWLALHRTKVRWRFCKIVWHSQNIWTSYVHNNTYIAFLQILHFFDAKSHMKNYKIPFFKFKTIKTHEHIWSKNSKCLKMVQIFQRLLHP